MSKMMHSLPSTPKGKSKRRPAQGATAAVTAKSGEQAVTSDISRWLARSKRPRPNASPEGESPAPVDFEDRIMDMLST